MNSIMKYLIIILLTLISWSSNAQWIKDTAVTNKLLLLEIRFWKSTDDSSKAAILLDKAELYKSINMPEQALAELERTKKYIINPEFTSLIKYEKILNYFLADKYSNSNEIILSSSELALIHKTQEYQLVRFQSLNESEKWDECKQELLVFCSDSLKALQIRQLATAYNYKDPEKCSKLSAIIPGLGEIKAGYPMKGVTSFLIHSGLIIFTGYNFYYGFYLTGAISGGLPFLKFYDGGKRLSEKLAEKHNEKEKNKLKKKYSEIIKQVIP
jgi:hypothetical protein